MSGADTNARILVTDHGTGWPYIQARVDEVPEIRKVLDEHRVRYWMNEMSISINGRPYTTVIQFPRDANAREIQALLDAQP
jgi:hypothetical protein